MGVGLLENQGTSVTNFMGAGVGVLSLTTPPQDPKISDQHRRTESKKHPFFRGLRTLEGTRVTLTGGSPNTSLRVWESLAQDPEEVGVREGTVEGKG